MKLRRYKILCCRQHLHHPSPKLQENCNIEVPTRCTCYRVYFYLTTALHVSGIIITHLQEHNTTVPTASGDHYTVLLSVAIVEKFQLFHDSNRQQYGVMVIRCCSYSCSVLLKMGDNDTRNM
jgi:hypothetical protein